MINFYFDTHIAKAVADQMRAKGASVTRCEEVDMAEAKDQEHLEYATQNDMVVVSQDDDFALLHVEWQEKGITHSGIMLLPKHLRGQGQISYAVRELMLYYELIKEGAGTIADLHNKVTYL